MFHAYTHPKSVGWLGWFESNGKVTAFIDLERRLYIWDGENLS